VVIDAAMLSFAVITTAKCRLLRSSDLRPTSSSRPGEVCRGSQAVSAFQTTIYSAVPLPEMPADADVFQTSVPCRRHDHHHHAVLDCFDVSSTTPTRNDLAARHHNLSSNAVIGNGRCPAVDVSEDDPDGRPRQRQPWRHGWAPRAAVLLRTVEDAFFPRSVVALLLTVGLVLCVDAAAVALDGVVTTLVDVDGLQTLVERGIEDSAASVNAFSDFLNAELTAPLCVDRVNHEVLRLTSLLHRRRFNVAGTYRLPKSGLFSKVCNA